MPTGVGIAVNQIDRYVGLSTDTKPAGTNPDMSEFFETDTGATFRWINSSWTILKDMTLGERSAASLNSKRTVVHQSGFNADIGNSEETVWPLGGLILYPSAAEAMTVSSGNANDKTGGTGAQTVLLVGIDETDTLVNEVIVMNGQTAVITSNQYKRFLQMSVLTAGSGAENEGIVYVGNGTVTAGVPANAFFVIGAGDNKSMSATGTIPTVSTGFIKQLNLVNTGLASPENVTFELLIRRDGSVFEIREKYVLRDKLLVVNFDPPIEVSSKADVEVRATTTTNDAPISAKVLLEIVAD